MNLVAIPLGDDVERAEGYDAEVRGEVVYVATLESLLVLGYTLVTLPASAL